MNTDILELNAGKFHIDTSLDIDVYLQATGHGALVY